MPTQEQVTEALKTCIDPELHMDIVSLGLIYAIDIDQEKNVSIRMTFTTMLCPFGPALVDEIKGKILDLGAKTIEVEVTFDPPWKPSEEVMMKLGL